ncbi:MAG: hypothetical protein Q9194_000405 [Teloschistes cf. exilis]
MELDMANEDSDDWLKYIEALKQRTNSGLESLYAIWDSEEDGVYLEQIHSLVNGHPLALVILTLYMAIGGPEFSPKRFMLGLLQGAPMITSRKILCHGRNEEVEGFWSLDDLDKKIFSLRIDSPFSFKGTVGLLATFWINIPIQDLHLFRQFQVKESVTGGNQTTELIAIFEQIQSTDLANHMSPTLRNSLLKLRTEKLDALQLKQVQLESYEYLEAEGLLDKAPDVKSLLAVVRKSLSQNNSIDAAAIEMEEAFSSHEGIFMFTSLSDVIDRDPLSSDIRSVLDHTTWIESSHQANLTELPQHDQASHPKAMDYIKISPLLTIMLRGHSAWYDDESFAASNQTAWDSAKSEADTEFYNLASAAAISKDQLRDTKRGFLVEEAMMGTLVKLDWYSMTDKTRAPIVQMLWEMFLNETQQTIKTLESSSWVLDLSTKVADSSSPQWSLAPKKSTEEITHVMEKRWPSTSAIQTFENKCSYLETCQVDPQTYSMVATRFQENVQEIHRHLKAGNDDAARELLEAAFEEESDYGQSDQGRRSALLFFSSIISVKQGCLSDSLRDLEEYRHLSSMPLGRNSTFTSRGMMTSFMRRSLI